MANKFYCDDVLAAAQASKEKINTKYNAEKAEILAPYSKPHKKYWLFGPVITPTEDDAVDKVYDNSADRERLRLLIHSSYDQMILVNEIITLTTAVKNNCDTHVNLTIEEFTAISACWEKK